MAKSITPLAKTSTAKSGSIQTKSGDTIIRYAPTSLSAKDTASRKASLDTIAKTNPALAKSLSPLATGGVQSSSQKKASMSAISDQKNLSTITSPGLTPSTPITLPNKNVNDPGNIATANNYGLTSTKDGLTFNGNQFVYNPKESPTVNAVNESNSKQSQIMQQALASLGTPVNKEKAYTQLENQSGVREYQQQVNDYTSQLNTIVANRDANVLRVEGQGRGIPDVIIGGQQAQINKEAAIAALPVQAQLAGAQGNLALAQTHLDTLWKLRSSDIDAQYQYNKDVINTVMDFATKSEQNLLSARLSDIADKKATEKANVAKLDEWSKIALHSGQSNLIAQFSKLDPASETFATDFGTIQSQVVDTTSALQRESLRASIDASNRSNRDTPKRDTQVIDGKLIDTQTGEVIKDLGTSPTPQNDTQAKANGFADRLVEAEKTLKNSDKFGSVFAVGGDLPNFLKTEDRQEFEQAKRNFINSVLRRESGAVISPQEFENAEFQYFPQRGDGSGVLSQKAANRNTVINSFYREANAPRPVNPGDLVEVEGQRYKVAEDGDTLIPI